MLHLVNRLGIGPRRLEGNARDLSSMAENSKERAVAYSAATNQATSNVEAVAASADELMKSVAEIGRRVAESSTITRQAVEEADRTNATVEGLASAAQKIGEVV